MLLNDERNPGLESELGALSYTTVLAPGNNLGVAMGRNLLFRAAIDAGADFVVSLDDDLYIPRDYLRIVGNVAAEAGDDLGVVAPTVMAFEPYVRSNETMIDQVAAVAGSLDTAVSSAILREGIRSADENMFFHLGTRDWKHHYLSATSEAGKTLGSILIDAKVLPSSAETAPTFLRSAGWARCIASNPKEVDTVWVDAVAGGVSMFSAKMLKEIGLCDERFSPFGFEDADLCIRALRAGYRIGWTPRTVLLHDFRNRSSGRPSWYLNFISGRARSLLASNHAEDDDLGTQLAYAMSTYLTDAFQKTGWVNGARPESAARLASVLSFGIGYLDGAVSSSRSRLSLVDRLARIYGGYRSSDKGYGRWIVSDIPTLPDGMGTTMSIDISVESETKISTSCSARVKFPGGLGIELSIKISRDASEVASSLMLHYFSIRTTGAEQMSHGAAARFMLDALREFWSFETVDQQGSGPMTRGIAGGVLGKGGTGEDVRFLLRPEPPIELGELAAADLGTAQVLTRLGVVYATQESAAVVGGTG